MGAGWGVGYYLARRDAILRGLETEIVRWSPVVDESHGASVAARAASATRSTAEGMVESIPFIGGDENHRTSWLLGAWRCLVSYLALRDLFPDEEIGRILYEGVLRGAAGSPASGSPEAMRGRAALAVDSLARRYPADYVYRFVPGDGATFDYGYDFLECAACKLFRSHGASGFLRYFCYFDYPKSALALSGLHRRHCLALGSPLCDHRYRLGSVPSLAWPPRFETGRV